MAKLAMAKKAPAKTVRASTEVENSAAVDETNVEMSDVESSDAESSGAEIESAQPETPKAAKPTAKAKRGPANGVKKAKNATPKPMAKKATVAKAKAAAAAPPKAPKGPTAAEMTQNALESSKDRKGITMAGIRKHITTAYQRDINPSLLRNIKKFLEKEFLEDRVRMVGFDGDTINFTKHFALVK